MFILAYLIPMLSLLLLSINLLFASPAPLPRVTQPAITCSKLTIETPEECVKYV